MLSFHREIHFNTSTLTIKDEMRMVTAKDLFFAAVGRGHEYSANIEDFLINKIEHLPKSKYFYLEKKKNPKIHISFLKKIPKHCLFSRF